MITFNIKQGPTLPLHYSGAADKDIDISYCAVLLALVGELSPVDEVTPSILCVLSEWNAGSLQVRPQQIRRQQGSMAVRTSSRLKQNMMQITTPYAHVKEV